MPEETTAAPPTFEEKVHGILSEMLDRLRKGQGFDEEVANQLQEKIDAIVPAA